jgi:hypothetical protein
MMCLIKLWSVFTHLLDSSAVLSFWYDVYSNLVLKVQLVRLLLYMLTWTDNSK